MASVPVDDYLQACCEVSNRHTAPLSCDSKIQSVVKTTVVCSTKNSLLIFIICTKRTMLLRYLEDLLFRRKCRLLRFAQ